MGLDSVELVMRIEEDFHIEITDKEASAIYTVGDMYRAVCYKLDAGYDKDKTWDRLCDLIVEQMGIVRERITPDAKFVDDLGID